MAFFDYGLAGLATKQGREKQGNFLFGTPGRQDKFSTLRGDQEGLYNQLQSANQQGSFGPASDYYRGVLSNDPQQFESFAAPEMRRFREQIIPELSEQFAGMGSGALSSSGFRNAAVNAGTDLSERLGAIRAQLRQNAAQGLMGLGQQGLQQFDENVAYGRDPGFLESAGPLIGAGLGMVGGPAGSAVGSHLGTMTSDWLKRQSKPQEETTPSGIPLSQWRKS